VSTLGGRLSAATPPAGIVGSQSRRRGARSQPRRLRTNSLDRDERITVRGWREPRRWLTQLQLPVLDTNVGRGWPTLVPIKNRATVSRETEHYDALFLGDGPRAE
jgi:hypothetical protein